MDLSTVHHHPSRRARMCHAIIPVPALQHIEDYVWWVSGEEEKKHTNWWCAICGGKYGWKARNRLLVVQTGESVIQAKVFKAHAVP